MLSSYPFIDASTEGYEGDDENIYGEEEGILWSIHQPRQANTLQDILMQVKLVQASKSLPLQYIYLGHLTYPKLLPCKLLSKSYVYSWPLSESSITTRVASTS